MAIQVLELNQLRKNIDLKDLPFKTTDDLKPLDGIIGQDRAIRAIELAVEMEFSGYNIFATGKPGTGRTTIIRDLLKKYAKKKSPASDWCFVYNFKDPDNPKAIEMPPSSACRFQSDMQRLIKTLKAEIKAAFSSEKYGDQKSFIINRFNEKKQKEIEQLNKQAKKLKLQIQNTPTGFQTIILKDGKPITPEEYETISEKQKKEIRNRIQTMENMINDTVRAVAQIDIETQTYLAKLDEEVAGFVVEQYINDTKEKYKDNSQITKYLNNVKTDITTNIVDFLGAIQKEQGKDDDKSGRTSHFKRYTVNVLIDNTNMEGAPVIYETNPTYNNLFGRMEKYAEFGTYITDFTMIKAGSLLKANGGYLIADAYEVFSNPYVYDALKRAIRNHEIRIEDVSEFYGISSVSTLKPESIPLNVKVVLIGGAYLYHALQAYDNDFSRIFKVRADFDYETDVSKNTINQYAQFIKRFVDQEKLLRFDKSAVREIIYYGHRLVEDQEKISLEFGSLARIIRESNFWATKSGSKTVKDEHIKKAIKEYEYRHSLVEERMQEMINREIYKINTSGSEVGQINGLSVYRLGDHVFGRPNRITAKTYIGNENVIHIDRKAHLSGKIYDKGVLTLSGFFNWKFGEYIPLSFSASIAFEQSYSRIDGDSASSTELYALISSLSNTPIKQGIAVTGSVNQNGEVQAIGGVNQKIEGYFKVCSEKGLTGEQGVLIPSSNIDQLMLKNEILDAVKKSKFHIWAADTIEEGLEILTGEKPGQRDNKGKFPPNTIFFNVEETLRKFSIRSDDYKKSLTPRKPAKKTKIKKKKAAKAKS
jgi:lon-related putative ATP-dependent protease